MPFLYVKLVDRRGLDWIGFHGRNLFNSGLLGVCSSFGVILVWYLFVVYYLPPLESVSVTSYVLFTDAIWYPFYEEIAYRGFTLAYLVPREMSVFSLRSLVRNFAQPQHSKPVCTRAGKINADSEPHARTKGFEESVGLLLG